MLNKILIINTVNTRANGITNSIFNLLNGCEHSDIICDYLSINEIYREDKRFNSIHSVIVIPRSFRKIFRYFIGLKRVIHKNKYDIVHIHGNSHTTLLELFASYLGGCKNRIVHSHSTRCNHLLFHKLSAFIFNRLCTHRFACGDLAGQWMFGNLPYQLIRNGIDVEKYAFDLHSRSNIRKKLGWDDKKILGHVGNFVPVKNHQFVIDVFGELLLKDDNYRLLLLGSKLETYNEILLKCKDMSIFDKVYFAGSVPNVNDYLCAIDVLIMPSLFEGVPLALLEAQASGLKCLVSDRIPNEVDKTGNVYFEPLESSLSIWAEKIVNMQTDNDRKLLSTNALSDIIRSGYSIKTESSKLFSLYKGICDNSI